MGIFHSRVWRAIILACGLAWLGPVAGVKADTPNSPAPDAVAKTAEPFGLSASPLQGGGLHQKWLGVQHRLDDELVQLALCDEAREGRARLGEINRAINLAIKPASDLAQYGEIDVWTSPLVTFTRGAGDCE